MKISFGSGHDHAFLVSSPTLNATGDAPCPSFAAAKRAALLIHSLEKAPTPPAVDERGHCIGVRTAACEMNNLMEHATTTPKRRGYILRRFAQGN